MAQQTAVEFLEQQIARSGNLWIEDFDEAKQMEKEQIINAYKKESAYMKHAGCTNKQINESAKKYYNETFGKS